MRLWRQIVVALPLLLVVGCRQAARPPNILLVTLDTVRADRLGCYGYAAAQTPALDRLAAQGVRLTAATTVAPITLPAHATMLTGLYPPEHGLRLNGHGALPADLPTITATLRARGYRTGAFIAFEVLAAVYGLNTGFEHYDDPKGELGRAETLTLLPTLLPDNVPTPYRRADEISDAALAWLRGGRRRGRRGAPWFAWVHYYDAHMPLHWNYATVGRGFSHPYDAEIAFMDHHLGRLLQWLDESGEAANTLVVAVGDHGEGLGEHGENDHRFLIYESTMHIPWIMRYPGRLPAGQEVTVSSSLTQLAPTILDLAGVAPAPALARLWEGLQWVDRLGATADNLCRRDSLAAVLREPVVARDAACYLESDHPYNAFGWAPLRGLRMGTEKYIRAPQVEYYDLARDGGETNNLARRYPERVATLERMLREREECFVRREAVPVTLSARQWRRLASLGYARGSRGVAPEHYDLTALENPVEVLATAGMMTELVRLIEARRSGDEALSLARQMVQLAPRTATFHGLLAQLHEFRHEPAAAIAAYREAIRLDPNDARYQANLGVRLCLAGERAAGIALLQRAHELAPQNPTFARNLRHALQEEAEGNPLEAEPSRALDDAVETRKER